MRFATLQSLRVSSPLSDRQACAYRPSSTFLGVSSLIATSTGRVHSRGHPRPTSFRPRRFSRPRRLAPRPALRVCFTPLPRPGFAPQGFSSPHSRTSSSLAVALLSLAPDPCSRLPRSARTVCPPTGLFSVRPIRCSPTGFSRRLARSPLELCSPLGFISADAGVAFTSPPATSFHAPRRLARLQPALLLRARPPV